AILPKRSLSIEHCRRGSPSPDKDGMARCPGIVEGKKTTTTTLGAGTMTGRKASGFVEEEKLGGAAGCHDDSPPPGVQQAQDPPLDLPGSPDAASFVMEDAPIAHKRARLRGSDDLAEGRDTVLSRHGPSLKERFGNQSVGSLSPQGGQDTTSSTSGA